MTVRTTLVLGWLAHVRPLVLRRHVRPSRFRKFPRIEEPRLSDRQEHQGVTMGCRLGCPPVKLIAPTQGRHELDVFRWDPLA